MTAKYHKISLTIKVFKFIPILGQGKLQCDVTKGKKVNTEKRGR